MITRLTGRNNLQVAEFEEISEMEERKFDVRNQCKATSGNTEHMISIPLSISSPLLELLLVSLTDTTDRLILIRHGQVRVCLARHLLQPSHIIIESRLSKQKVSTRG